MILTLDFRDSFPEEIMLNLRLERGASVNKLKRGIYWSSNGSFYVLPSVVCIEWFADG